MAATTPAPAAPAAVAAAPKAPRQSRSSQKDDPPKTTADQDLVFLKIVVDVCATETVTRACQSLKWYVDNVPLILQAMQALAALARDNSKKQTLIQQRGGLASVVQAMVKHPADVKVQEEACNALIMLCDQNDSNANVVSKAAMPVLLDAMKTFEKQPEYVGIAVHAMDIVCAASSGRKEAAAKGVAAVVVSLMQKHPTSARIQERGTGVIRHIASDAEGKKWIHANVGVPMLVGLKKLFPNSSLLDENVTEAVKRITDNYKCTCAPCAAYVAALNKPAPK